MEEPLLSDSDWAYGFANHRSLGEAVGKGEAEQGAEAPEAAGGLETGTVGGMCYRERVPD